jgi:hypothetical protein
MLQPKQVKCTDGYGHFKTGSVYDVAESGFIIHDGYPTLLTWYNNSLGNSKFEPIYTNEELLEYAKKMYPMGTKYIKLNEFGQHVIDKCESEHLPNFTDAGIYVGRGYVYIKQTNTWAEIVSEPEKEECFLTELNPWRDLTGYEVMNTVTGEKSKITSHQQGGGASLKNGGIADLHNTCAPHSMVNKNWRVFDKDTSSPKFKEGESVIYSLHSHIKDFTVVACRYEKSEYTFMYLISSPDFEGHTGHLVDVIYGKLPGTSTCWWAFENELTLDHTGTDSIAKEISLSGVKATLAAGGEFNSYLDKLKSEMSRNIGGGIDFANGIDSTVTITRHVQDQYDLLHHHRQQLKKASEWIKGRVDLLEVPPLRVSRKNIVK